MEDKNTITIQGWMINELKLSGNRLICFALIYQFSQDGKSAFNGSLRYISKWINCSHSTTRLVLKGLEEEGFIGSLKYTENKNSWTAYKVLRCTKIEHGCTDLEQGCTDLEHKCTKIEHINNTNNNTNNNNKYLFIEGQKVFDLKEWILNTCQSWFDIMCMNNNIGSKEELLKSFMEYYLNYEFSNNNHFRNALLKRIERKKEKISGKKEKGKDFRSAVDELLNKQNDEQ